MIAIGGKLPKQKPCTSACGLSTAFKQDRKIVRKKRGNSSELPLFAVHKFMSLTSAFRSTALY